MHMQYIINHNKAESGMYISGMTPWHTLLVNVYCPYVPLHIRLVCEDIVSHSLWCHPPQRHLVLEGGHVLRCVSGETKV